MAATKKDEEIKVSVPLKGVYAKLQAARIALMEKGLKKTGKNSFAGFDFFQLVDFLPEAQKIFTKLGLTTNYTLAPRVIANKEIVEGEKLTREPIIRDIARLVIRDIETNDIEVFEIEAAPVQIGNNTKQNIYQAAGGRSTYYKRYLYRDALEIEESDESDMVLGAPNIDYQTPVAQQPIETPQPTTIQENIMQPQENTTPAPKKKTTKASADDVLSQESREEVMQVLTAKGLNPFNTLMDYCKEKGLTAPSELKESDKEGLLSYIEGLDILE